MPNYRLYSMPLGGGLGGAELARQLVVTTTYTIVFVVVFRAFSPNWTWALCVLPSLRSLRPG